MVVDEILLEILSLIVRWTERVIRLEVVGWRRYVDPG